MEAGMCSCDYDGESPDLFEQRTVIVRKNHRCCECGDEIPKATKCEYTKGLWDGDFYRFYTCSTCARIRRDFCAPYGNLWEELVLTLGPEIK